MVSVFVGNDGFMSLPFHHSVEMRTMGPPALAAPLGAPLATAAPLAPATLDVALTPSDVEQPLAPLVSLSVDGPTADGG